jgi:hypothetical protein
MTACVRRSSSGASSRNVYGCDERMPRANADGSGVSTATRSIVPSWIPRSTSRKPSTSIASVRQSSIV